MTDLFDHRQVRRAFSRAAHGYDNAAALQREVASRLMEQLDYLDDPALNRAPPQVVLDVGCGPAHATVAMQKRWPKAQVVALDLAQPMLQEARRNAGGWRPFSRRPDPVCADARALPLRDGSVDVLFSNLCLQWVEDLPAVFAGFRRVLKPDGLMLVSTFGPDTLHELRGAFADADNIPHVSPFASIAQFGDALIAAGFKNPVLDRDEFVMDHADLGDLMRELRTLGATNANVDRRRSLTGRARFARAAQAYEPWRRNGKLPATWEVIYAHAWGPQPGTPIRVGGVDEVQVPVSRIPIRKRS
jgi:malonyl-CoA O-methyltransferase